MINELTTRFPLYKSGQPKDAQFMAISLEGGAIGISFVLLPDEKMEVYTALQPTTFVVKNSRKIALEFGNDDPVKEMISLSSINAICQQVMRETTYAVDSATDSLGLLSVSAGGQGRHGRFVFRTN